MAEESLQTFNRQQKEALWAARIKACRESGMGVKPWCEEHGLSYHTYYRWQSRIFRKCSESANGFYEVSLSNSSASAVATVHVGMYSADVYSGADEQMIRAVVRALKSC